MAGIRPLTAFVRVVEASRLEPISSAVLLPVLPTELAAGLACLPIAEVSISDKIGRPEGILVRLCSSTLSFALLRGVVLYPEIQLSDIINKWIFVHRVVNDSASVEMISVMREIFGAWSTTTSARSPIGRCFEYIQRDGWVPKDHLRHIGASEELARSLEQMKGDREQRVRVFEDISRGGGVRGIFKGYAASLISSGTFSHFQLVRDVIMSTGDREAFYWYCFLSGLYPENDVLSAGNALGRRILRDLTHAEYFFSPSRADISFEEFSAVAPSRSTEVFRRQSPSYLTVELVPGVITSIRWSAETTGASRQLSLLSTSNDLKNVEIGEDAGDLAEAISLVRRLERILIRSSKSDKRTRRR